MPVDTGLTNALLAKLFHTGNSDKEIAKRFGISVQAVSKRRVNLGLYRKKVSHQVNEWLATRWDIWSPKEGTGHHNAHAGQCLKAWIRLRLGDDTLSEAQKRKARQWENRLQERDVVLCYDRNRPEGWYYRPRTEDDERCIIDWPADLPFPDPGFQRALDLPPRSP